MSLDSKTRQERGEDMRRLWLSRWRWALVATVALLGMQSAWGGNGCRDTIRLQCQSLGWRYIHCCQILSNRYNFALCYCEQFRNSEGATNYFSGGITDTGPSCVQQNDTCC